MLSRPALAGLSLLAVADARPQWGPPTGPSWSAWPSHGWGQGNGQVPSPQSLNSDLTIITHNDLYANMSTRTDAALVLSTPQTQWQARAACAALGEQLWYPDHSNGSFLQYLAYQGKDGPYWIGDQQGSNGATFTADGKKGYASCETPLPALCTQSAPLANLTYQDNSTQWQTTVNSGQQSYTGFRDRFSFRFEGIRYATQPARFTYSSVYNGTGHSDALEFQSECVQAGGVGSEDCLFLNIWSPYLPSSRQPSDGELKPVMFWIHGGAFTGGTGSDPTFDGGSLVSRGDVVVVTINYRLGTLGFLALNNSETYGNYGLADQITALDWVHEHIRNFGGNPNRITIFGQSAGAASVRALLASPKAIGKYAAAVPQSNLAGDNYASTYSNYYTIDQEVAVAAIPVLNATGCLNSSNQLSCLRALNPHVLGNLSEVARYVVQDGTYIVTPELEVTGKGPAASVPVMMGIMRDDGAAFISYPTPNTTVPEFLVENGFNLSDINPLSVFPEPNGPNATLNVFNETALISTDSQFRCLDEATAYSASLHNVFPTTYFYEFNRSYQLSFYSPNSPVCNAPITPSHPHGDPSLEYFKCHSGELYYVFGTVLYNDNPLRDDLDIPMSQLSVDTWAAFARSHDPTPSEAYLGARGFSNTTLALRLAGGGKGWESVQPDRRELRLMEWPPVTEGFGVYDGQDECRALGFGIDYYERSE